ncbi:EamA family transporter [Actinoplanes sp. NPDC051633]|uniref:DMT family transporter n=1 Tax=Actinoplanes sp. NPDC051633 TaxID=3155670 RepID=UPI00343747D3
MSHDHAHLSKIAAAAVLWGTTGVAVTLLSRITALSPITIGFYRLAIAAVALLAYTRIRTLIRPTPSRAGSLFLTAPGRLVLTGVFLGLYQALYFISVANAGVGVATMVSLGIAPIGLLIWESIRARRRPSRRALTVATAAVAGLALISAGPSGVAPRPWLGLVAAIGSGLGYAISAVLSRSLADRADPLTLTAATSAIGALALLPIAAAAGLTFTPGATAITLLLYLGVTTTAVAYALFYAGLRGVAGSAATVLTLLEPVTAALLAAAVLGETLAPAALVGGGLVLAAVVMLAIRPAARRPTVVQVS